MSTGPLARFRCGWRTFWFSPSEPFDLAAARIIVSLHALWVLLSWDIGSLSGLPEAFWWNARASSQWRFLVFPGHPGIERLIQGLAIVAVAVVLVGVATRVFALAAAVMLYHLAPLHTFLVHSDPHNRGLTIATLSFVVLAAAPCADAWSVTARRRPSASWEYTWPVRLMQVFVAAIYVSGFYGKLYHHGLAWFTIGQMKRQAVLFHHVIPGQQLTDLGRMIASSSALAIAAVGLVIVVELCFVTVLFSRIARRVIVPLAAAFHVGIWLTMQIFFTSVIHLLLFVNWTWLRSRLRSPRRRHESLAPVATI